MRLPRRVNWDFFLHRIPFKVFCRYLAVRLPAAADETENIEQIHQGFRSDLEV